MCMANLLPTYKELLAAYSCLQQENEKLKAENKQLRHRLQELGKPSDEEKPRNVPLSSPTSQLSVEERVALFRSLFKGREDVFARRWYSKTTQKAGYQPVCLNEWRNGVCDKRRFKCAECPNRQFKALAYEDVYRHLEGKSPEGQDVIGAYAILADNTCHFLCADFDDKSCEHGYQKDVLAYVDVCKSWGAPCSIERSRSGNGAHVWIFFEQAVPAAKARKLGFALLTEAMEREKRMSFKSYDRFFPNQDTMPDGGFGNLVALPLQGQARRKGNSVFVDESFTAYPAQWTYLSSVKKVSLQTLDNLLAQHGKASDVGKLSTSSEKKPWETPKHEQLAGADFPSSLSLIRANMLYIPTKGLSAKIVNHLKRIASFRNPEFYAKQGMRLPTFNVPRIVSCYDMDDDYLALPRGCEETAIDLFKEHNVSLRIEDKANPGHPIKVQFKGTLRTEQQDAVNALLAHTCGILNGTTAFGKTVAAIGLIAERKVNTLILVHTKALLDQWKSRLEEFLYLDFAQPDDSHKRGRKKQFSPFGTLDSKGNSLHGQVDIALMQSCFDDDEVKSFVRDYGMVIVDECHHVSAVGFERIMKFVNARYVYGLTATPIRKDGHQPIIFMQCGSVRYSADAKAQMQRQTFERLLVPRFTSYRNISEEMKSYTQIVQDLAADIVRNKLILDDACRAIEDGRTPIILTTLTSHVETMAQELQQRGVTVITLVGTEKAKEKREKMLRLQSIGMSERFALVATGKYVGEGFDCPRLDTLLLALPVSWKGLVAQYAGRLHREYSGKKDVRIYDYIDLHVPLCDTMYKRRMRGYSAIGYKVLSQNPSNIIGEETNLIYNGTTYRKSFLADLQQAKRNIIITAKRVWFPQQSTLLDQLAEITARGADIVVFVKEENEHSARLTSIGARVIAKASLTVNVTVIDKTTTWYGNVPFLGYATEEDSCIRLKDASIANDIINMLAE